VIKSFPEETLLDDIFAQERLLMEGATSLLSPRRDAD
jgi:hypothetical protein